MKPTREIDSAPAPGGGELSFAEHDGNFSIHFDGQALLNTRATFAHETLARLGCNHILAHPKAKVLIGGLGMGMVLRAALDVLRKGAMVTVTESVPAVIEWNRLHLGEANGEAMSDPRATVMNEDFLTFAAANSGGFDTIFTDFDGGPDALLGEYGSGFDEVMVEILYAALKPGGILAVSSARKVPALSKALREARFEVETFGVKAYAAGKKPQNSVILARRRD